MSEKLAYSISEFCSLHGISRSTFYNLVKAGRGPRTMRVNGRTLISKEAAEHWRRLCEVPTDEAA
jgi:predicted DNA-binding transcriptional regulator AlpA